MTSEALRNPYFVRLAILYINIDKTHFYKIVKNIGPNFLYFSWRGGGGGACGQKMVERKCKSENA